MHSFEFTTDKQANENLESLVALYYRPAAGFGFQLSNTALLAQVWGDHIRNVDIVETAEERRPNDHQYEHEPKERNKNNLFSYITSVFLHWINNYCDEWPFMMHCKGQCVDTLVVVWTMQGINHLVGSG